MKERERKGHKGQGKIAALLSVHNDGVASPGPP